MCISGTYGSSVKITVDLESAVPIYSQLVQEIKRVVAQGNVKPGDALPSIRQLANDLYLNSKTVAKAYRLLERDRIIQTRGYRGTFVHQDALEQSVVEVKELIEEKLACVISELRALGATDSELRIAFNQLMKTKKY